MKCQMGSFFSNNQPNKRQIERLGLICHLDKPIFLIIPVILLKFVGFKVDNIECFEYCRDPEQNKSQARKYPEQFMKAFPERHFIGY